MKVTTTTKIKALTEGINTNISGLRKINLKNLK